MDKYILTDEIVFDAKPDAVPYNYRISYKLGQICLIIGSSCSGRSGCSFVKLHIISSALNTRKYMEDLMKYIDGRTSYTLVRFDPAVNRAVKFALADKLISQLKNGSLKLTDKGKTLLNQIKDDNNLMIREKEYLAKIGNRLTEKKIENLMSVWGYENAKD